MIYGLDEKAWEGFYQRGDWDGFWRFLLAYLGRHDDGGDSEFLHMQALMVGDCFDEKKQRNTNLFFKYIVSKIITAIFDKNCLISDSVFYFLLGRHETIHTFFRLAASKNTDELVQKVIDNEILDEQWQKRLVLLLSLDTDLDIVDILNKCSAQVRGAAILAFLGYDKILNPAFYENKLKLIDLCGDISELEFHPALFGTINIPFYRSSFLDCDNKDDVKKAINSLVVKAFDRLLAPKVEKYNQGREAEKDDGHTKPTLVVFEERFSPKMAMYRSFMRRMSQLKSSFRVVLVSTSQLSSDDKAHLDEIFSETHFIAKGNIEGIAKKILDIAPQVLYFPSIGLTSSSVLLSNFRFAPMQMMSLGCLTVSHSEFIDYVVNPPYLYCEEAFGDMKFVSDGAPFLMSVDSKLNLKKVAYHAGRHDKKPIKKIRVGVVGTIFKLSEPYIRVLQKFKEQCAHDVKFVFIMDTRGMRYLEFCSYMKNIFGDVEVYPYQSYDKYIKTIASIDMAAAPFPFGHTHTLVDILLASRPCVCKSGVQPHGRIERAILEAVGLDDEFCTDNNDDYLARLLELADDIAAGKRNFFDPQHVHDTFYRSGEEFDFGKVVKYLYDHHDELRNSEDNFIDFHDDIQRTEAA